MSLFAIPYVLLMFFGVRPLLRRLVAARTSGPGRLTPGILAMILVGLLLSCYATEWLGVHFIFGAFIFGAVMPRAGGDGCATRSWSGWSRSASCSCCRCSSCSPA